MRISILLCSLFVLALPGYCGDQDGTPIVAGRQVSLFSKVLGEQRPVYVHLPLGYEKSDERYPVLYLLDGESLFYHATGITRFLSSTGTLESGSRIPGMIVVGIPNVDRMRDLAPNRDAARFIAFLKDELIPFIDQGYRTQPFRVLAGHCLAGLFTLHAFMEAPDAFQAHLAISPYMLLEGNDPTDRLASYLNEHPSLRGFLYIAMGKESEEWVDSLENLVEAVGENAPKGLNWKYARCPEDGHGSEVHKCLYEGLETIFSPLSPPEDLVKQGADAVTDYYAGLAKTYGYTVEVPEGMLNLVGYACLQNKEVEKAIEIFERNVEAYPRSWNVYDSLGEALMAGGRYEEAIEQYKKSIALNPQNRNGFEMLKKLEKKQGLCGEKNPRT